MRSISYLIYTLICTSLITVLFTIGCADNHSNPSAPSMNLQTDVRTESGANRTLWGLWNINIDPATLEAEIVPLRGVEFTANVTRFMQPPASPTHMVGIKVDPSSDIPSGHLIVDVTLRHPFPGYNQYNGFDVRGIFMADGSLTGHHDSTVLRSVYPQNNVLLNADGYTRWWNWTEFLTFETIFGATHGKLAPKVKPTATVNPYKYFAAGLGLEDPVTSLAPDSRGFFPTSPGICTRRYDLQFITESGAPKIIFNYAVDASWELPDPSYAPDYPKEAFPISANCHEAFNVSVTDAGSTAFYVSNTNKGGDFVLNIEVFDWQGGAKGNVPGEISGLWIEGDILGGAVDVMSSASILPGSTINSAIYKVTITPSNLTASGDFELFITVESADPNSYKPQVAGGSNFIYPDAWLSGYFTCKVHVLDTSPAPPPVVTGINPNNGIPDCTEENVTVTGSNFVNGAVFRLEKSGEPPINASNVQFVNSSTLKGDLLLKGAAFGEWDVVVQNPDGKTGSLPNGFTVKEVLYVDGDNAGNPGMNGSMTNPFDTIQKGIDAAAAQNNKPVIVDQCATPYAPFVLKNNSYVIGCNWNNGTGWPTVKQTNSHTYAPSVNNATIEGIFFDLTINSGDSAMVFSGGNTINLRGCKFSGVATGVQNAYFVRFGQTSNVEIDGCWFTKIFHRGPDIYWRALYPLYFGGTNYVTVRRSEFNEIGYDVPDAGAFGNSLTVIRFGYDVTSPRNVDLHNLLIYNIFDKTNCIRPSPNPDPQNWLTVLSLSNINSSDWVGYMKIYNITIDDIRHADTPATTTVNAGHCNAAYWAMVGGNERVWKNNIASNIIPTDDSMVAGNSSYFGWWVDNLVQPPPSPQPMDYSLCFNIGKPLPPGANTWQWTSGFVNQCQAGVGSYQNYQDINPQYDKTPGSNYYHPTNPLISKGADDGTEMGAFGGPEGNWIPPSQK